MTQPPTDDPRPHDPGPHADEPWGPAAEPGDPPARRAGAVPLLIAGGALVLVLVVVLVVSYLTARAGPSGQPTDAPSTPPPPLVLPVSVGDLSRDPNAEPDDGGVDTDLETVSATYARQAQPSLVVIAGRPVSDPAKMLELVEAQAVRPIEDGLCGRDPSGYDVCVVVGGNVAVLGLALTTQPVEELLDDTRAVSDALPR